MFFCVYRKEKSGNSLHNVNTVQETRLFVKNKNKESYLLLITRGTELFDLKI